MPENLIQLLKDFQQDYDHPWPNEDELTKIHRMNMLKRLQEVLNQFKIS